MRKVQKQEVLEMIQTLHQAHGLGGYHIDRKNWKRRSWSLIP